MNTQERIELLAKLQQHLLSDDEELQLAKQQAHLKNPWFTQNFINLSIKNIAEEFLEKEKLQQWISLYECDNEKNSSEINVGIVMPGNIPLVGFHDFLCVFMSGHKAEIKLSSKDEVLLRHIFKKLNTWNPQVSEFISFAENLKNCNAYIATGSNNSGRYFEYYFGKYPNIIRRNRTSVAIISGAETHAELELLADDIQQYFGLGCRNVTRLLVPVNYDFVPLLNALKKYDYFIDFHKYKNNYDYQLALLILNNKFYMTNNSVLLTENNLLFSPIGEVYYEFYENENAVAEALKKNSNIQCIVGNNFMPFGKSQKPSLSDYADGVDTMQFLCNL